MNEYFEQQIAKQVNVTDKLFYITEIYTPNPLKDTGRDVSLDMRKIDSSNIPTLANTHEFLRYSNDIPVFKLKEGV